jgi:hypothetical protein
MRLILARKTLVPTILAYVISIAIFEAEVASIVNSALLYQVFSTSVATNIVVTLIVGEPRGEHQADPLCPQLSKLLL